MTGFIRRLLPLALLCALCGRAAAEDTVPQLSVMQAGAGKLLADLEFLVKLGDTKANQEWKDLKETVELFAMGIERTKPIRIDVVLDGDNVRYRSCFPYDNLVNFKNNLDGFGITAKPVETGLSSITDNAALNGFMRLIGKDTEKEGYALIATEKKDIPADFPDPKTSIEPLLKKKYDAALQLLNTAEGKKGRQEAMQHIRKEALAALKKRTGEEQEAFALRKTMAEQQLAEAERFIVESSVLEIGWFTDAAKKEGRLELHLAALPESDLFKTIGMLAKEPSRFAAVPRAEKSILSLRVNHALDDMRKANFVELFKQARAYAHKRAETATTLDEVQKPTLNTAADVFFDMLTAGANMGVVDGYMEVTEATAGQRTLTAGIHAQDGLQITKIVELLPKIKSGFEVQLKAETVGPIEIHKITTPKSVFPEIQEFFGGQSTSYVAAGPDSVWFAAGPNALESLKAAIAVQPANGAAADPRFVEMSMKFGPWIQLMDKMRKDTPAEPSEKQVAVEKNVSTEKGAGAKVKLNPKNRALFRQMAIEAFAAGKDTMTLTLRRVDDHVEGSGQFDEGTLRFAGKMIAWFAKQTL